MNQKGFTLVELIVTVVVVSIGVLGVFVAFATIQGWAHSTAYRTFATQLASEGMEIVQNIRDTNIVNGASWSQGLLSCSAGCQSDYKMGVLQAYAGTPLNIDEDGLYSYDTGNVSPSVFKRKITIQSIDPSILKVIVQVDWNYGSSPYSLATEGYLYAWY